MDERDSSLAAFCNFLLFGCELPNLPANDSICDLIQQPLLIDDESCVDLRLPLFFAVQSGNIERVQYLLDRGANIYHTRPWGLPALSLAVYFKQYSLVETLTTQLPWLDVNRVDPADCFEKYFYHAAPGCLRRLWISKNHSASQGFGQFKHPLEIARGDLRMVKLLCVPGRCSAPARVLRKALEYPDVLNQLIDVAENLNQVYNGKTVLDLCFHRIVQGCTELMPCAHTLIASGARLADTYSLLKPQGVIGYQGQARLNHLRWLALSLPYELIFVKSELTFKQFIVDLCLQLRDEQISMCNGQKLLLEEACGIDLNGREAYTASLLRNFLHHISLCNVGRLPFQARELGYLFEEDFILFPEQTAIELLLLVRLLQGPLSLKDTCRIAIISFGLNMRTLKVNFKLTEDLCRFVYKG